MGDQTGQPNRMHRDTVDVRTPGAVQAGAGGIGVGRHVFRASAMSRAVRAAVPDGASALCGWCSSITSTDSKYRAACLAKCMHSTAPIAKFGAMRTETPGASVSQRSTWLEPIVGEAGGADDGVYPVLDEEPEVVHDDIRMGEVDDDVGVGVHQSVERLVGVDPDGEGHIVGGLDGLDHRRADLAFGAQNSDSHAVTLGDQALRRLVGGSN